MAKTYSLNKRVIWMLFGFILGILVTFGFQKWRDQTSHKPASPNYNPLSPNNNSAVLDEAFEDENLLLDGDDPFEEMRKMRERLLKPRVNEAQKNAFDHWYGRKMGGGDANEITRREDEHSVYYDLVIDELAPEQVKVKVIDTQLHISGKTEKKTSIGGLSSFVSSTFTRSIPAPENVDTTRLKIHQTPGKLTIEFPKR